jgi:hypothetical protein
VSSKEEGAGFGDMDEEVLTWWRRWGQRVSFIFVKYKLEIFLKYSNNHAH